MVVPKVKGRRGHQGKTERTGNLAKMARMVNPARQGKTERTGNLAKMARMVNPARQGKTERTGRPPLKDAIILMAKMASQGLKGNQGKTGQMG
jgi:hypothetical protein